MTGYSFPLLSEAEILACLRELDLPISQSQLARPTFETVQPLYASLVTMLIGVTRRERDSSGSARGWGRPGLTHRATPARGAARRRRAGLRGRALGPATFHFLDGLASRDPKPVSAANRQNAQTPVNPGRRRLPAVTSTTFPPSQRFFRLAGSSWPPPILRPSRSSSARSSTTSRSPQSPSSARRAVSFAPRGCGTLARATSFAPTPPGSAAPSRPSSTSESGARIDWGGSRCCRGE